MPSSSIEFGFNQSRAQNKQREIDCTGRLKSGVDQDGGISFKDPMRGRPISELGTERGAQPLSRVGASQGSRTDDTAYLRIDHAVRTSGLAI